MSTSARSGDSSRQEKHALTPHQARMIELLMDGYNIKATTAQLRANGKTCRRWLKLPHVKAYTEAMEDAYQKVLAGLRRTSLAALKRHLEAEVEPTVASQIRAVQIVHDLDRVTELEKLVAEYELRLRCPWRGYEQEENPEDDE